MKNDILEAMNNIYAMKLVNWEFEGKHEWVENCLAFSNCKPNDFSSKGRYIELPKGRKCIIMPELSEEEVRWCIGYAHSKGTINIKAESKEMCYTTEKGKEYFTKITEFYFD